MFENKFVKDLVPYKLSTHRAWEFSNDADALKLDWNEACITPSPLVIKRLIDAVINKHLNWYPDVNNNVLIQKIANYSEVGKDEVLYFASSDAIHEYIIRCYIEPQDKILIIGPTYDNFRAVAETGGADIEYCFLDDNFSLDFDLFQNKIESVEPKLIYLVNPNNPTGSIFQVESLLKIIMKNPKSLFIIDEAYYEFTGITLASKVSIVENLIITRTFSKAFALASLRIGYVVSNQVNIKVLSKVRNAKNISLLAQIAAEAALDSIEYTNNYIAEVLEARNFLYRELLKYDFLEPIESKGNFILIKFYSNEIKYEFIRFLENYKIFVRDYSHVKALTMFLRITIGTKLQMQTLAKTINKFSEISHEANSSGS